MFLLCLHIFNMNNSFSYYCWPCATATASTLATVNGPTSKLKFMKTCDTIAESAPCLMLVVYLLFIVAWLWLIPKPHDAVMAARE